MAHDPPPTPDAGTPGPVADGAHGAHGAGDHAHPTWGTYIKVAVVLTVITAVEVWVYYVPAIVASRAFVPMLLIMSAAKFVIVVLFYMHLKYDHRLFRVLFSGPLVIAVITIVSLMLLFGKIAVRLGLPG